MVEINRENLIETLRAVAERLGKSSVPRSEFEREAGISEWQVMKFFDSWNEFVSAAGLEPTDVGRIPDDTLWEAMREAFIAANGVTTRTRFRKVCRFSDWVYSRRWGRWDNVLSVFRAWVEHAHPDFPYSDQLPQPTQQQTDADVSGQAATTDEQTAWQPTGGRLYGPILNFRGLQHAPINEQGVVFLFGMVAFELGFVVESVATGFPDCEAKRRVSRRGDMWERVRIEFEYQSRTFRDHGHDPARCDVIICWEDNWPDAPVEVLELKSAIAELES